MHTTNLSIALVLSLAYNGSAQDIDSNDVPSQCASACAPVVTLTQTCDQGNGSDDQVNCVCAAANASSILPICEACYAMYDPNDGHDNDVHDLITKCNFETNTYNPSTVGTPASATSVVVVTTRSSTITSTATVPGTSSSDSAPSSTTDNQTASESTGAAATSVSHWMAEGILVGALAVIL